MKKSHELDRMGVSVFCDEKHNDMFDTIFQKNIKKLEEKTDIKSKIINMNNFDFEYQRYGSSDCPDDLYLPVWSFNNEKFESFCRKNIEKNDRMIILISNHHPPHELNLYASEMLGSREFTHLNGVIDAHIYSKQSTTHFTNTIDDFFDEQIKIFDKQNELIEYWNRMINQFCLFV